MFASLALLGCLVGSEPALVDGHTAEFAPFETDAGATLLAPLPFDDASTFDEPFEAAEIDSTEESAFGPHDEAEPMTDEAAEIEAAQDDAAAPGELSPEMAELRSVVRQALELHQPRHLNTRDHSPWELMHGYVAWGVDTLVRRGGPEGDPVNALAYVSINGPTNGQRLLRIENGRVAVEKGPGVQGHHGQFLAILAQSRVPVDYPLTVDGKTFTVADLIESEKLGCRSGMELTFKLIAMSYYLPSDATWTNADGEEWSISRLIREEIAAPIHTAACGGTHRLMGYAYAVHYRKQQQMPIDGEFARAEQYTRDYHDWTFKLQNPDGSFSTAWLRRGEDRADLGRKLQTSGHILEWLAFSLPSQRLRAPETQKAVKFLSTMLVNNPNRKWDIGPLGHGLHGLLIYDRRVFGGMGSYVQPIESYEADPQGPIGPLAQGN